MHLLIYFGKRYYDPESGRWISADCLFVVEPNKAVEMPLSYNLYAYVRANPMTMIDLDGSKENYMDSYYKKAYGDNLKWENLNAGDKLVLSGIKNFTLTSATLFLSGGLGAAKTIGSAIGAGFSGYQAYRIEGEFNENVMNSISIGSATGLIPGFGKGLLSKILLGGVGGATGSTAVQLATGTPYDKLNWKSVGVSAGVGVFSSSFGYGATQVFGKYSQTMAFEIMSSSIIGGSSGYTKIKINESLKE